MLNKGMSRPAKAARTTKAAKPAQADQRIVRGQVVVADEPCYSPLPPTKNGYRATLNMRVLTLEDGTRLFECGTCYVEPDQEFVGARGEVMKHRRDVHGFNVGGYTREKRAAKAAASAAADKVTAQIAARATTEHVRDVVRAVRAAGDVAAAVEGAVDGVVEPAAEPAPLPAVLVETSADEPVARPGGKPAGPLTMPLCEVIDLVMSAGRWGDAVARTSEDRDYWKKRATEAERLIGNYKRAFARLGFVPRELDEDNEDNGEVA